MSGGLHHYGPLEHAIDESFNSFLAAKELATPYGLLAGKDVTTPKKFILDFFAIDGNCSSQLLSSFCNGFVAISSFALAAAAEFLVVKDWITCIVPSYCQGNFSLLNSSPFSAFALMDHGRRSQ